MLQFSLISHFIDLGVVVLVHVLVLVVVVVVIIVVVVVIVIDVEVEVNSQQSVGEQQQEVYQSENCPFLAMQNPLPLIDVRNAAQTHQIGRIIISLRFCVIINGKLVFGAVNRCFLLRSDLSELFQIVLLC